MWQRLLEGIYMPHGYCLMWEPWLVGMHAVSDLLTFGAYSAIPVAIWIFLAKRPDLELKALAYLFAAFILWCGLTHLFGLITLWHPVYEFQAVVKAITAAVSVTTAFLIFPLIPKAVAIPSPRALKAANMELEREIGAHRATLVELQQARADLEERVKARTRELSEATQRFAMLFEHAPIAMIQVAQDGTMLQANSAAAKLFAADQAGIMGRSVLDLLPGLQPLERTDPANAVAALADAAGGGRERLARRIDGEEFAAEVHVGSLPDASRPALIASVLDISERKKATERIQLVMRELSHRTKNLLAVIQGMVRQAMASSPDLATFESTFRARLHGLARSHDLLVGRGWEGASLDELVRAQLAVAERSDREAITVEGPTVTLGADVIQSMGLALHELATNALKYGALSCDAGTVHVSWQIFTQEGTAHLRFVWEESGCGPFAPPKRAGFGRTVLERMIPDVLEGTARMEFKESGLTWTLEAPLATMVRGGKPAIGSA